MTDFIVKHKLAIVGIFVGGILGFAYYYFVGCNSGSCAITSKPLNSSAYGMLMGYLMFSVFENSKPKKDKNAE